MIEKALNRYTEAVFPSREKAMELLLDSRPLTFYLGIDPTGPDLHLGNATNLLMLKKLQDLGHKIILLIGDFTAQTGDPMDKEATRRSLTEKEVRENMRTYLDQVCQVLEKESFEVKYNSAWLGKMELAQFRLVTRQFTVQQMIVRDMFQKRLKEQKPITLEEFLYPLMQGYDSVAMEVDGEIGGTDQTFNMMVGRDLVAAMRGKEKIVITTKLLEDPVTGKKIMNKSEGRYIALNDKPGEMFGKIMAMPDWAIIPLWRYTTEVEEEKVKQAKQRMTDGENPKNLKIELAFELVNFYHGPKEAGKAQEEFEKMFSRKEWPEKIDEFLVKEGETSILSAITKWLGISRTVAKKLISQKAVSVNNKVVEDWNQAIEEGDVVKVGPRRFVKIVN